MVSMEISDGPLFWNTPPFLSEWSEPLSFLWKFWKLNPSLFIKEGGPNYVKIVIVIIIKVVNGNYKRLRSTRSSSIYCFHYFSFSQENVFGLVFVSIKTLCCSQGIWQAVPNIECYIRNCFFPGLVVPVFLGNRKKTITSHKVYTPPVHQCGIHLTKVNPYKTVPTVSSTFLMPKFKMT